MRQVTMLTVKNEHADGTDEQFTMTMEQFEHYVKCDNITAGDHLNVDAYMQTVE